MLFAGNPLLPTIEALRTMQAPSESTGGAFVRWHWACCAVEKGLKCLGLNAECSLEASSNHRSPIANHQFTWAILVFDAFALSGSSWPRELHLGTRGLGSGIE